MSNRGPGTGPTHHLFQTTTTLESLEHRPTPVQVAASHGDGASFVLQALDEEADEEHEERVGPVQLGDPPGGGQPNNPNPTQTCANDNAGDTPQLGFARPLAQDMLDTIAQLDIDVNKLNRNVANRSS